MGRGYVISRIAKEGVNPRTPAAELQVPGSEKPTHIHSPTPGFS